MFYLNETLDATTAQGHGLITEVISGDFDKEVMDRCTKIAGFSNQVSFTTPQTCRFLHTLTCT